jgi:two-component system cell cycle response regulator
MVDVDHFKRINDLYGHDAGDRVLCGVASRISARLREVDTAARFGGEEFALLLPQTPKQGATIVAERIAGVVRREHFAFADGSASVTVSVGVAESRDVNGDAPEALVKAADSALYLAKSRGRDQVVVYSPQTDPPPAA